LRTVRHNRARPGRPVLPSCLGVPVAVIQCSHVNTLPLQLPPLLRAHPSSAWGLSHSPSVMPSTVTPSSPIQTHTLRKKVQRTSSLASRLSKALVPRIEISGSPPPPSDYASSLAVIRVPSRGIPDGLPGPLPPLPLTLGLHSQKLNALQVDARIPGLIPRQLLSLSSSQCIHRSCHHVYE